MDASIITLARKAKGLSIRQLSDLASIAPSTTSRIERGEISPTIETFTSLLNALGMTLALEERPDLEAIRTARWMAGDTTVGEPNPTWVDRYTKFGDADNIASLCWRASRYASFQFRACNEIRVRDLAAVRTVMNAPETDWVLTGSSAADIYSGNPAGTGQFWVYAADPAATVAAFAGVTVSSGGVRVLIAELDETSEAGTVVAGKQRLAAPLQVVIDCFSGPGRMADQAWAVLERLGVNYADR